MVILWTFWFIVLDFVTGFIKAVTQKNVKSSKLRQGLYHKAGFIITIILAVTVDYGQHYYGVTTIVPVTLPACIYITITEITSIIENVSIINPQIVPDKLKSILNVFKGGVKK